MPAPSSNDAPVTLDRKRHLDDREDSGSFGTAGDTASAARGLNAAALQGSTETVDLLDLAEDPLIAVDGSWRVTLLNAAAERILGRRRGEVAGQALWTALPGLRGTPLADALNAAMDRRSAVELDACWPGTPGRSVGVRIAPASGGGLAIAVSGAAGSWGRADGERLQLALEAAALGDWSWDIASDLVTFSDRAAAIFEIPPGPHMGWTRMQELLHPDDVERVRGEVREAIDRRTPYRSEYRVRTSGGGWRWVAALGSATVDQAGRIDGMIGVVQDISRRKDTAIERELSAERLTRAHRAARAAAWEWDLVHQEVTWSDPEDMRLLLGGSAPLSNPTPMADWLALIHPQEREVFVEEAEQAVRDGHGRVQFRVLDPAGAVRWLESSGQVVSRAPDGTPLSMRGITLDITERKAAEQRLKESEAQFKTLSDRVPNFVWFGTPDGRIHYLNRRWYEYTGQREGEALDFGWTATVHPEDAGRTMDEWQRALSTGNNYEVELRYRRHDGEYRWYVARAEPLKDATGAITGWFGTSTDIHERRQAEEEARAESEALEILNRTGAAIASEIDLERVVQTVTDAGVELTGAQFGAFFYNLHNEKGESYTLYTISGVPREHFSKFPMPRNTQVFEPTFRGDGIVRSDDITQDPRYGRNAPYRGMPEGHLPVRSYLAVPVVSRSAEVIGGLFFGHSDTGVFSERDERLLRGIAAQAAIAIDNARLFRAAQHEIAQRVRKEVALRESEEFSRSVVESSGDCIKVLGLDGTLRFMNESGRCRMEIEDLAAICGRPWSDLWPRDSLADVEAALEAARGGGIGRFSAFCPTAKGTPKWWDVIVTPVLGADDRPIRLVSISRDITEQRKSEEARQLLLRELNHRVKNLFAIASGMVTMTARNATSVKAMAEGLKGRLHALAKAHELIRSAITTEVGHQQNASLRSLIEEVVMPHLDGSVDQLTVDGPDIDLGVSAATGLALIFHELATNAAKYGALASPHGRLAIAWRVRDGQLELDWEECISGMVIEPPCKEGFGSQLARSSATGQLGGSISYDWRPTGVRIELMVPVEFVVR